MSCLSLVSECRHWVEPRRVARREPAGCERDRANQHRNQAKRQRIGRSDSEQETANQPRQTQRTGYTDPLPTMASLIPSRSTNPSTLSRCAPKAVRMPISRVRRH